jgi:hypothetical protein
MSKYILIILSTFLLAACGNIDEGKAVRRNGESLSSAYAPPAAPSSGASYAACKDMTAYGGTDPTFAQNFASASACASTSQLNLVRLKVSAYFPSSTRVCLVPLNFQGAFNATCFAINGQLEVSLTTEQFTAVALVRESDLGAYVTYIRGQSSSYPAMGYAALR